MEGQEDKDDGGSAGKHTESKKVPQKAAAAGAAENLHSPTLEPDISVEPMTTSQMIMDELIDPEAQAISKMPIRERVSQVFT